MIQQRGFSLVELMIALVIGLLLILGLSVIYERNSSTRYEVERNSRQLENGRYALDLLANDIRLAGYMSSFTSIPVQTTLPANPCATALATVRTDRFVFLQGYDNTNGGLSCVPNADFRAGTDVIVIRRASACTAANPAEAGCTSVAGAPYYQASGCETDASPRDRLDTNTAQLTLKKIGCGTAAPIHQFLTHIYYVANNNLPGDGVPTLKRWELGSNSTIALVEGIESLHFEYGIDTNNVAPFLNGDGSPDTYKTIPANIDEWNRVVAVKIHLLSRNETTSPGYTDNKFYMLGETTRVPTTGTFGDGFRRHVFSTLVVVENPAGRK